MALPAGAIQSENIFNSVVVELVGEVKYGWNVQADKCYHGKIAANGPGLSVIVKSKGLYGPDCLITLSLGGGVQAKYRIGQTCGVLKGGKLHLRHLEGPQVEYRLVQPSFGLNRARKVQFRPK